MLFDSAIIYARSCVYPKRFIFESNRSVRFPALLFHRTLRNEFSILTQAKAKDDKKAAPAKAAKSGGKAKKKVRKQYRRVVLNRDGLERSTSWLVSILYF